MMSVHLPHDPRAAMQFGRRDAFVYDSLCKLAAVSGVWRYPAPRSGDLEEMTFLDKVYWVYKGSSPVRRAEKSSGLESFFATQCPVSELPNGFDPASSVRICAVGDLMNHPYLARSSGLFDEIEGVLFGADIATANLECVVVEPRETLAIDLDVKAGPPLAMSHDAFKTVASRFHFLATACNHSIDFGAPGVSSTIAAIRDAGVAFHGVNESEPDAARATLLERNGIRIAFLSHTFGTNAHPKPADRPWIVNHTRLNRRVADIDFDLLQRQLAHCRAQAADFVIAQLHWGMEFEMYPRRTQVEVARHIAEMGVDAIVGHHPHVLQPAEYYRTSRDPNRIVPIYYSLGNLTTPFAIPYMCRSGIADLTLSRGRSATGERRTYVARSEIHEVEQTCDPATRQLRLRRAQ
jgi:poly-gamma-glutamate synthesis protein (capsule biosynthesis protein)